VRCADITRHSCGTPNSASMSLAARMFSQSDLLPIMTDTSGGTGAGGALLALCERESLMAIESTKSFSLDDVEARCDHLQIRNGPAYHWGLIRLCAPPDLGSVPRPWSM